MPEKPSLEEVARVRALSRSILLGLRDNPELAAHIRRDPTGALVSRGVPEAAALEWQKPRGDVSGYDGATAHGDDTCGFSYVSSAETCFDSVYY